MAWKKQSGAFYLVLVQVLIKTWQKRTTKYTDTEHIIAFILDSLLDYLLAVEHHYFF